MHIHVCMYVMYVCTVLCKIILINNIFFKIFIFIQGQNNNCTSKRSTMDSYERVERNQLEWKVMNDGESMFVASSSNHAEKSLYLNIFF